MGNDHRQGYLYAPMYQPSNIEIENQYKEASEKAGIRYNEGKPKMSLVPPEAIEAMAQCLTQGLEKYPARNWEAGMNYSNPYDSAMRHLMKWFKGVEKDDESGLPHLWHALTNLAFLVTYETRRIGTDDRPTNGARK